MSGNWTDETGNFIIEKSVIRRINLLLENNMFYDSVIDINWSLELASIFGDFDIVKYLVKCGADLHLYKALKKALQYGNKEIAKFLVLKGANINVIEDPITRKEMHEYKKLHEIFDECMQRIHFDPKLERTRTEQIDFYFDTKLKNIC